MSILMRCRGICSGSPQAQATRLPLEWRGKSKKKNQHLICGKLLLVLYRQRRWGSD
jgi:hypothetical protein